MKNKYFEIYAGTAEYVVECVTSNFESCEKVNDQIWVTMSDESCNKSMMNPVINHIILLINSVIKGIMKYVLQVISYK